MTHHIFKFQPQYCCSSTYFISRTISSPALICNSRKFTTNNSEKGSHNNLSNFFTKLKEESIKSSEWKRDRNYFAISISIFAITSIMALAMRRRLRKEKEKFKIESTQTSGKPRIGGKWTLTDHDGKIMSSEDLKGNWLIYYFGFIHCPDVCPEEMEKIGEVVSILKSKHKVDKIIPVFVTVDPERDTPEKVKDYVLRYSPHYLGLSGTMDEIAKVAKDFKIFYSKSESDEFGNYQVDHSIVSYLFDPEGEFSDYFTKSDSIQKRVNKFMKNFKMENFSQKA